MMDKRNDLCWCGSGKKWKFCHFPQKQTLSPRDPTRDPRAQDPRAQDPRAQDPRERAPISQEQRRSWYRKTYGILLKTEEQIAKIRRACTVTVAILEATCERAKPGVTTLELNDFAHDLHLKYGAIPAPLHYGNPPYPKSICTSLNEVICHGIPDKTILCEGDILNIDVSAIVDGYYGDCSCMVVIGKKTTSDKQKVVDVAYECLVRSVAILRPGLKLCAIGDVIEDYAGAHGCSVVNQFVGHGVGLAFHESPQVFHSRNRSPIELTPGMIFTIEPMINGGAREAVIDPKNHWEARTIDALPSAQWEHTVLITEDGHEILTPWKRPS